MKQCVVFHYNNHWMLFFLDKIWDHREYQEGLYLSSSGKYDPVFKEHEIYRAKGYRQAIAKLKTLYPNARFVRTDGASRIIWQVD